MSSEKKRKKKRERPTEEKVGQDLTSPFWEARPAKQACPHIKPSLPRKRNKGFQKRQGKRRRYTDGVRIFPPVFPARRTGEIVRHWSDHRGEELEMGNASFLEASRRSWREGGAIKKEE